MLNLAPEHRVSSCPTCRQPNSTLTRILTAVSRRSTGQNSVPGLLPHCNFQSPIETYDLQPARHTPHRAASLLRHAMSALQWARMQDCCSSSRYVSSMYMTLSTRAHSSAVRWNLHAGETKAVRPKDPAESLGERRFTCTPGQPFLSTDGSLLAFLLLGRTLLVAPLLAVPPLESTLIRFTTGLLDVHLDRPDPGHGILGHGRRKLLSLT